VHYEETIPALSPSFYQLPKGQRPREQSKELDRAIGYGIPKIEQKLLKKYQAYDKCSQNNDRKKHYQGTQTWIGLHPQVLQTPYSEILEFLTFLKPYRPKRIIDCGAGYGRVGVVMSAVLPHCQFIGYEIVDVRLQEATRIFTKLNLNNCQMRSDNLIEQDFELPDADVYFVYDFSDPHDLRVLLKKLTEKIGKKAFFLIARGEGICSLIQNKYPIFYAAHGAIHRKNYSIYSTYWDLA
jgi:tRNA G46 methylase TrmB